jgi:hypothetical protein
MTPHFSHSGVAEQEFFWRTDGGFSVPAAVLPFRHGSLRSAPQNRAAITETQGARDFGPRHAGDV